MLMHSVPLGYPRRHWPRWKPKVIEEQEAGEHAGTDPDYKRIRLQARNRTELARISTGGGPSPEPPLSNPHCGATAEQDIALIRRIINLWADSWVLDPDTRNTFPVKVKGQALLERAVLLRAKKQKNRRMNVGSEIDLLVTDCREFWGATGEHFLTEEDLDRGVGDRIRDILGLNIFTYPGYANHLQF